VMEREGARAGEVQRVQFSSGRIIAPLVATFGLACKIQVEVPFAFRFDCCDDCCHCCPVSLGPAQLPLPLPEPHPCAHPRLRR
jgi:hypothetical protein